MVALENTENESKISARRDASLIAGVRICKNRELRIVENIQEEAFKLGLIV
jgi:hypothetical protein